MPTQSNPVIAGAAYFLAHVPHLVEHGSKPSRELAKDPTLRSRLQGHLRHYQAALAYPPHQVFLGNLLPDELSAWPNPWYAHPIPQAARWGPFGEIMPEAEFYGALKLADDFDLVWLEEGFLREAQGALARHPLIREADLAKLGVGVSAAKIEEGIRQGVALPLEGEGGRLVGCVQRGHEEDASLAPEILLENLAARASAALALRTLLQCQGLAPEGVAYLLGCGEEAVGDRYNRGGGSLAKAIGELAGCVRATGSDVKAFCCAPVHALVMGASLVAAGTFPQVVVVGGGSLAKLGMKFLGHLRHDMPILEDVLAALAVHLRADDGKSPVFRLDAVGKHEVGSGAAQQAILEKLVVEPLARLGLGLTQVDKYATEMHNPEITEPAGSGNVPRNNYRLLASLAVLRQEIPREELESFVRQRGMPGYSPTQGHIASAVPFLGHALEGMKNGHLANAMFLAKGSLFLGRMTQLSDGISFLLERNPKGGK